MFSIELYVVLAEYLLIFYLLLIQNIIFNKKIFLLIGFIFLLIFPSQVLSGEIRELGIFIRILPVILFMSAFRNSIIALKTFFIFFALNFIISVLNFALLKAGIQAQAVQIGELSGTTRYYLGFSVSTSFFETGNLLLARFQGFAWEPAPLGILSLISLILLQKIDLQIPKTLSVFVILAVLLSKSYAAYLGAVVYKILSQHIVVILTLILFFLIAVLENYSKLVYFATENTSILVRISQMAEFFENLTAAEIFFGSGYGVYEEHQTNIFVQMIKDFGLLRAGVAIILMIALLAARLGLAGCLTIIFLFSSLNLAFSNYFVAVVSFLVFHGKKIN